MLSLRTIDISDIARPLGRFSAVFYVLLLIGIRGDLDRASTLVTAHQPFSIVVFLINAMAAGYCGWVGWKNLGVLGAVGNRHNLYALIVLAALAFWTIGLDEVIMRSRPVLERGVDFSGWAEKSPEEREAELRRSISDETERAVDVLRLGFDACVALACLVSMAAFVYLRRLKIPRLNLEVKALANEGFSRGRVRTRSCLHVRRGRPRPILREVLFVSARSS